MKPAGKLLHAGEITPDPKWRMSSHLHPFHELIVVLEGRMRLRTGDVEHEAAAGDLLFYRAGLVHEETSLAEEPVHTLFASFRHHSMPAVIPLVTRDAEGRIRQLMTWLVRDFRTGRGSEGCEALLAAVITELAVLTMRGSSSWLDEARSFLGRNFARRLQLPDIARHMEMSPHAFLRKFKRQSGNTPMAELRAIRLNEARNLVLTTSLPLKAVAPRSGLGDEYQLAKLFRRHFGMAPGQMRSKSALRRN